MSLYNKIQKNISYVVVGAALAASFAIAANAPSEEEKKYGTSDIKLEGFPKGYILLDKAMPENPTKGSIIKLTKLPGERYDSTKIGNNRFKYVGNFKYEIACTPQQELDGLCEDTRKFQLIGTIDDKAK